MKYTFIFSSKYRVLTRFSFNSSQLLAVSFLVRVKNHNIFQRCHNNNMLSTRHKKGQKSDKISIPDVFHICVSGLSRINIKLWNT